MTGRFTIRASLWRFAYAAIFILLIVWQIPGTIGLRYGLLVLLLPMTITLVSCRHTTQPNPMPFMKLPLFLILVLTGWIILVIAFWGQNPGVSWSEFRGQWLSALGTGLVGLLLARAACKDSDQRVQSLTTVVFWALLAQVLLHDVLDVVYWASTSNPPFRQAPVLYLPELISALSTGVPWQELFDETSPDKFSYVNNILAAFLVAEISQRLLVRKRWLMCSNTILVLGIMAMLLCSYWLQIRNGNAGLLLLLTFALLMMATRLVQRFGIARVMGGAAAAGLILVMLSMAMLHSDPRWQKLAATIPAAMDTQTNSTWLTRDGAYPKLSSGEVVDISAYERLAWAKEAVTLVVENPMGLGYNRLAFGAGIDAKYHMNGEFRAHSHSGVLDFAIANGWIGLTIWLAFLLSLFVAGWHAFRADQVSIGLILMFLVSGFMGRSLVDSNIRDHVLQQFMFMVMLFYGLVAAKGKGQARD